MPDRLDARLLPLLLFSGILQNARKNKEKKKNWSVKDQEMKERSKITFESIILKQKQFCKISEHNFYLVLYK
jgi:hypothetical protein